MSLTGKAKVAGIIGWPVSHSLSPLLHGYWLKQYGIDGTYVPLPVSPESFSTAIDGLRRAGFVGVNVTVPHKEAAFALAHIHREGARVTGAANLLFFLEDGRIAADNTDGTGLADSLMSELGPASLGGKDIVLLGAGGAARGAVDALYRHGVARITVLNRNRERAHELVRNARTHRPDGLFEAGTFENWSDAARNAWLVVNTTSAGMKGNPPLTLDLSLLPKNAAVCDIVYNPQETMLLKQALKQGLRTIDGLGMLMHQAAPSFQAFFYDQMGGKMPEVTPALRATLEAALAAR